MKKFLIAHLVIVYKIIIPKKVVKQIEKIPLIYRKKIRKTIACLLQNPFLGKKLEGELKDRRSIRLWPYRIIYKIYQKEVVILILAVSHRQGVYK